MVLGQWICETMNKWQNALGAAVLFTCALGIAWLMVKWLDLDWDRALLVQILWLTTLNRWHQPDSASGDPK